MLTIIGNATLPVFALLIFRILPAPCLWLSFLLSELLICSISLFRYFQWVKKDREVQIQIMVRLTRDAGKFIMIDDGRCIALDENEETKALITDNYGLLKKVAKSVEYQYILNLNHTVISF